MGKSEKNTIRFLKTRVVKNPARAHDDDAGIDFYVPSVNEDFIKAFWDKNPGLKKETPPLSGYISVSGTSISSVNIIDPFFKADQEDGRVYFELKPGKGANIPSGIHCQMSGENKALIAFNKSGISTKFGLVVGAQVVDIGYQGEIHINVINTSNEPVKIYEGQKLVQFIEIPIFTSEIIMEDSYDNLYSGKSDRGDGGFSSTGLK